MRVSFAPAPAAALTTAALTVALAAPALAATVTTSSLATKCRVLSASTQSAAPATFFRETVSDGDQDTSPSSIAPVRDLQVRLQWAGVYAGPITGYFGDLPNAAVQRYRRRTHLPVSGIADDATWRRHPFPDDSSVDARRPR